MKYKYFLTRGGWSKLQLNTDCFRRFTKYSPREIATLEEKVLSVINIKDPILKTPLRTLGWIRQISVFPEVKIHLHVPSLMHPSLSFLKEEIIEKAKSVVSGEVKVIVSAQIPTREEEKEDGLKNVKHFVAVYSCKGGVGKSTVAVNLAYSLAKMGGRVGMSL